MPAVAVKKEKTSDVTVVKNMRDYSGEPAFQKKAQKAKALLKKNGLPNAFTKKKK